MKAYLDTSVIVALFVEEALSPKADRLLRSREWLLFISNFASAEFSSALSRRVRMQAMPLEHARQCAVDFDAWLVSAAEAVDVHPPDIARADGYLRRFDLKLRTPDAIHVAIANRLSATLLTFDLALASDAARLGVPVAGPD